MGYRIESIGIGLLVLLAGCAFPGTTISIPRQPMADALTEWAAQSGYQLVVPDCDGMQRSRRIHATNAADALDRLLAGTGMTYWRINERTVAIECPIHRDLD